jgi:surface antigen
MQRLGSFDVEVRDGYVVAARDAAGRRWAAARQPSMPRLFTHALVMAAVAGPFMVTAASAHPGNVSGRSQARVAMLAADVAAEKEHRVVALATATPAATPVAAATVSGGAIRSRVQAPAHAPVVGGGGHFAWGWCTWYVSTKRYVPWMGNAIEWFANAAAMGFPEGSTPRPGAIMVTRESGWGHVAYVESVDADGKGWTVSEMNFHGFGVISSRHITTGHVPLVGFIY